MGTFVNTSGSGGVDLSSMKSGERWLYCSISAGTCYTFWRSVPSGYTCAVSAGINSTIDEKLDLFDFSDVQSVQFEMTSAQYGSSVYACIYYCYQNEQGSISDKTYQHNMDTSTKIFGPIDTSQHPLGYFAFINNSSSVIAMGAKVYSFTTTDGKTHTATNLNY